MRINFYLIIVCLFANLNLYSQNGIIELDFAQKKQQEAQLYILTKDDSISLSMIDKNVFINNLFLESINNVEDEWTIILIKLKKHLLEITAPGSIFACDEIKINIQTKDRFLLFYCGSYAMAGFYQKTKIKKNTGLLETRKE